MIPKELQHHVIDLANEGHQGIMRTKALLREKAWFPRINQLVEECVKSCLACQIAELETSCEPLQMSPLPDQVRQEISINFVGLSTGYCPKTLCKLCFFAIFTTLLNSLRRFSIYSNSTNRRIVGHEKETVRKCYTNCG